MSFSITDSATIAAIRAAYNSSNWPLAYQLVYDAIINPFTLTPLPGVDPAVAAWISGARKVNLDSGPFASYIRDYTARQFELRTGQNPGESAIQAASDLIARRFIADLFGELGNDPVSSPPPSLPPPSDPGKIYTSLELKSLQRVGEIDAAAAASDIFRSTTSDNTAHYSPWAGTVLFANLGEGQFFRDWILTLQKNDFKRESGTYDLIAAAQALWNLLRRGLGFAP